MNAGEVVFEGKTKDGLSLVIRYLKADDVNDVLSYINTLSKEKTSITFQGEQLTFEEEKKYVDSQVDRIKKNKSVQLLAFADTRLVGITNVDMFEKTSKHVGVFGISIAKEYRNHGVGKLFMQKTLEEAKKNLKDLKIITLSVFANNPVALKMYQEFGFKEYGILPNGVFRQGEYSDHVYMYKAV